MSDETEEEVDARSSQYARIDYDGALVDEHVRNVPGPVGRSEDLFGGLGTTADLVWPSDRWPAMSFEDGIAVGHVGGHGAVRYVVEEASSRHVRFRFTPENSFSGEHSLWIEPTADGVRWAHTLRIVDPSPEASRLTVPVHDAVIEDLLDQVEAQTTGRPLVRRRLAPRVLAITSLRAVLAREPGPSVATAAAGMAAGVALNALSHVPHVGVLDDVPTRPAAPRTS